ncbi:unnamed protein product [Clonostachys chloroleuca]|uniref:Uncharacterized protein n=1 Tax=Clonostachys chloroleuca TaxID=1926264 RepID=A0AA35LS17_9HYPO|nr:unnamed protein product [Clonostachys chloroleuca]
MEPQPKNPTLRASDVLSNVEKAFTPYWEITARNYRALEKSYSETQFPTNKATEETLASAIAVCNLVKTSIKEYTKTAAAALKTLWGGSSAIDA